MSLKSILFNTDMVRAILDGRKSTKRLVVKPQYGMDSDGKKHAYATPVKWGNVFLFPWADRPNVKTHYSPPYRPGDILYVRETWAAWSRTEGLTPTIHYKADGEELPGVNWHPSIHMPREAARIWLLVTDVRVERLLQGGADVQARAEGCSCVIEFLRLWNRTIKPADRERYGWAANPWVWVVEFERCAKPEEADNG